MSGVNDYRVFGLQVRSELALPELPPHDLGGDPDVKIERGAVAVSPGSGAGLIATDAGLVLAIDGIANYRIADGSRIVVDAMPGVPDANVRLYLLGSAMGVLLHQRGLLPLHANCVEIGGKAFAFVGSSGAGKSTLAAWFHDRGNRVLADDVCVIRFDQAGTPFVSPGLPRLRLWKEALEASGRESAHYDRSYAGDETYEKFDVSIRSSEALGPDVELECVYALNRGPEFAIACLDGLDAAQVVFANTYRGRYLAAAGDTRLHWESCLALIRHARIFRLTRPWKLSRLGEDAEQIVAHAEMLASGTGRD